MADSVRKCMLYSVHVPAQLWLIFRTNFSIVLNTFLLDTYYVCVSVWHCGSVCSAVFAETDFGYFHQPQAKTHKIGSTSTYMRDTDSLHLAT